MSATSAAWCSARAARTAGVRTSGGSAVIVSQSWSASLTPNALSVSSSSRSVIGPPRRPESCERIGRATPRLLWLVRSDRGSPVHATRCDQCRSDRPCCPCRTRVWPITSTRPSLNPRSGRRRSRGLNAARPRRARPGGANAPQRRIRRRRGHWEGLQWGCSSLLLHNWVLGDGPRAGRVTSTRRLTSSSGFALFRPPFGCDALYQARHGLRDAAAANLPSRHRL